MGSEATRARRSTLEAEAPGELRHRAGLPIAPEPEPAALVAHDHVLERGHGPDQLEVLVDHADAVADGVARLVDVDRPTVDPDLAAVGAIEAGEDVHQRRLAGAVLAEQRVQLARTELELRVVEGDRGAEALVDRLHAKARRRGHAVPGYGTMILSMISVTGLPFATSL